MGVFPDLIRIDSLTQIKELTGQHLLVSDLTLFKLLSDTNDVCFLPSVSGEKLICSISVSKQLWSAPRLSSTIC